LNYITKKVFVKQKIKILSDNLICHKDTKTQNSRRVAQASYTFTLYLCAFVAGTITKMRLKFQAGEC